MYTIEYYSSIKRNEIVSLAEMCIDLENVIKSENRKRKTNIVY